MATRDRVEQAGTATSATVITMDGAANTDRLTFEQGFQMPTVAQRAGVITWRRVPVLIERAAGGWGIHLATVARSGTGVITVTVAAVAEDIIVSSNWNATVRRFDNYGLAASDAVTVSVTPSAAYLGEILVKGRGRFTDWQNGDGENLGSRSVGPFLGGAGLLAIGDLASTGSEGETTSAGEAVAIGYATQAGGRGSYALGFWARVYSEFSAAVGGFESNVGAPYQLSIGNGEGFFVGGRRVATHHRRGIQQGQTANATPFRLRCYGESAAELSNSQGAYTDIGVAFFSGTVMAFEASTQIRKLWKVEFMATTDESYSTVGILGTPVITELLEQAGSEAWSVAVFTDDDDYAAGIEVTGEAAKSIAWSWCYDQHAHECW